MLRYPNLLNPGTAPARDLPRIARRWLPFVIVFVLLRMYIVGDDELVLLNQDAMQYSRTATHFFSEDAFSVLPSHRPGMSALARFVSQLGVPYKLFVDLLLATTALAAGLIVERMMQSWLTGVCVFVVILFNPWFIVASDLIMTEPLISLMMVVNLLLTLPMICRPIPEWKIGPVLLAVLACSIYITSRNEFLLLVFYWFTVGLVVLFRQRKFLFNRKVFSQQGIWRVSFILFPLVGSWLALQGFEYRNYKKFGVTAACVTEAPGLKSLMNVLYTIPPEKEVRFAPVTRATMARACENSETLRKYSKSLLDLNRTGYRNGAANLQLEGEFGTWVNWHLVDCFGGINWKTAKSMELAAEELRMAQKNGTLGRRPGMYPVNPMWRAWLPEVPGKLWIAVQAATFSQFIHGGNYYRTMQLRNSVQKGYFDDGLSRRRGIGFDRTFRAYGKSMDLGYRSTHIQLTTSGGELLIRVPVDPAKHSFSVSLNDVETIKIDDAVLLQLVDASQTPEVLSTAQPIQHQHGNRLGFIYGKGNEKENAVQSNANAVGVEATPGKQVPQGIENAESSAEYWRVMAHRSSRDTWRKRHRQKVNRWYLKVVYGAFFLAMVAGFRMAGFRNADNRQLVRNVAWFTAIGVSFVLIRCLFYSLIDVWLRWGLERYVEPNVLMSMFCFVCLGFLAGAILRGTLSGVFRLVARRLGRS